MAQAGLPLVRLSANISARHLESPNVIAEGVETEVQRARLKQMQCHEVQSYYYSSPLSGQEATALVGGHVRGFAEAGKFAAS